MSNDASPDIPAQQPSHRTRNLILLAVSAVIVGVGYGAYWELYARFYQSTDDCYVDGDLIQVTSEATGTVIALKADDTQGVERGQLLLQLDPADARVAMGEAEADLARAVRQVRALFATADQLRAQIKDRQIALSRARDDFQRRVGLLQDGAVSDEEFSHTKDSITQMQANLAEAQQQLNATAAQIDHTDLHNHPQVLAAETAVRNAALALRRTQISAPEAGVIAQRSVQLGQHISAGMPLMAVVPLDDVWVDANFKEVQLAKMRVGQPVTLKADVYGGEAEYHGRLVGLAAGSGSTFALLPAQNASGNWIKIVQRVPVRISLDSKELAAHPLRLGLSMTAEVDIRDTSGRLIATQVRSHPLQDQLSLGDDPLVEARIEKIISANAGGIALSHRAAE